MSQSADWVIPQKWSHYSASDHATWRTLFERQTKLLPSLACREFIQGMNELPIGAKSIPNFEELSDVMMRKTGWQIVAVPGLVPDDVFFTHLANRRFPAGNFIRRPDQLDYLEEPDVFHDVFGHIPMLMNPAIADFIEAYGHGGLRASGLGKLAELARVYWYTIEFGLVQQDDGLRLYGAGIASSAAESKFCIESRSPNRIHFDLARVMRTQYRIDDFQETYFVIQNLEALLNFTKIDFLDYYIQTSQLKELEPSAVLPQDHVHSVGDGSYHLSKRQMPRA